MRSAHRVVTRHEVIEIDRSVAKTYVKLKKPGCHGEQILLNNACVFIDIKRKGSCDTIARYNAFEVDVDGSVGFYWDDCFLCAAPGWYEGEIFADCGCGCSCDCEHEKIATVSFVKRRTRGFIDQLRNVPAAVVCAPVCPPKQCCDGDVPSSM